MTAALPRSPVINWPSVGTMTALTAPSPRSEQASLASENRLAGEVALSSFRDTTLQWPWVAPLDRTQPGPGCWRSVARLHPCNVASLLTQEQLSEGM
jgi:hypothetical protein